MNTKPRPAAPLELTVLPGGGQGGLAGPDTLLDLHRARHIAAFAADYPEWTVLCGQDTRWTAYPLPAGTPAATALRIPVRRTLVRATPTELRELLAEYPTPHAAWPPPPPAGAPPF